jgi:hypothetical protein
VVRGPAPWLEAKGKEFRDQVRWATLDLSGPYRAVFDAMLPAAVQVANPFHVCKLANTKLSLLGMDGFVVLAMTNCQQWPGSAEKASAK